MNLESSRLLVMFAMFVAPKIRLSRFSPRLEALELELVRHSQVNRLLMTFLQWRRTVLIDPDASNYRRDPRIVEAIRRDQF